MAPFTVFVLVMNGTPSVMLNVTAWLPVPLALAADSDTGELPVVVGVPDMTPVAAFKDSPAGSADELKLVGLFVAAIV